MMRPLRLTLAFLLLAFADASSADAALEARISRIENALLPPVLVEGETPKTTNLRERMRQQHVPGLSIAVIHKGEIDWARGYGVTRFGGPPVTPATLFQAASISKPVAALAALQFVDAGKLELDADVNRYLTSWKVPDSEFSATEKVTLRRLLTHSAGMSVSGFPGYASGAALPTLTQILNGEPPANTGPIRVERIPGASWQYSGGGYTIVQQLLIDVSGVPFPRLLEERVLAPLGMEHSTFAQPLQPDVLARAALGYRANERPVEKGPHVYPELAAAGLWTTPSDLARYAIGVQRSLAGKSPRVLSPKMTRMMLTAGINGWGLGPVTGGATERKYFQHSGGNEGYRCLLVAYADGEGAIVMINSDAIGELLADTLRTIANEYGWPDFVPVERTLTKIAPAQFDRHAGAYEMQGMPPAVFWREDDRFYRRVQGQPVHELFPSSADEYFLKAANMRFVFSSTHPADLEIYRGGTRLTAKRMDEAAGRRLIDESIEISRRIREQRAAKGSETALRELVQGLIDGRPNYDRMTPPLADLTRQMLAQLRNDMARHGALRTIRFASVEPSGGDTYVVAFEHGELRFTIGLAPDGRMAMAQFTPN
jgi:CubicO group peptidase (beta-lactamase class C family)